jgi:glycosyltransferase involved in cell wall biosynthesis
VRAALRGKNSRYFLHATLNGAARIGVDLRPHLRRVRDVILRPIRSEMSAELSQLRREIEQSEAARARDDHYTRECNDHHWKAALAAMETAMTETARLRARVLDLEDLLASTPAVRPPGAAQRVAALPSPVVSVVLPTFNRARLVTDAIASVQAQNFRDWELIVVDDGSDDTTAREVAPYLADDRIRYVQQCSAGVSAARNHGIRLARGSLIAYLDSDNVWYPGFLSAAVDVLATEPATEMVYGALVTEAHPDHGGHVLWAPFDRRRLMDGNYLDTNVIVHRKSLVDLYGGWDEMLERLVDWDLVLRYTQHRAPRRLPTLAARYRTCDGRRITVKQPAGPASVAIQSKWYPNHREKRRPRVLYTVWHYPQLSETYLETEIRQMRAWGVHIEVWCEAQPASPYATSVPIHSGSLADAVATAQPDLIQVHWLNFALLQKDALAATGRPVTLRLHGFDVTSESLRAWLNEPWARAMYAFPHHVNALGQADSRVRVTPAAFETALFRPHKPKDRRLVIRTAAALPSKDIPFYFELAKRLPGYCFVFAGVTCSRRESYVEELKAIHRNLNSPAELMFDVPREKLAPLIARAGVYLHTAKLPGTEDATPIGMPVSIAEAMATGAYVLVRDIPELAAYVGDAGAVYRDVEHAAELIEASATCPEEAWEKAWMRSVDRAFQNHADLLVFRTMFEDWCALVTEAARPALVDTSDGSCPAQADFSALDRSLAPC